jgi:hypothetical protein
MRFNKSLRANIDAIDSILTEYNDSPIRGIQKQTPDDVNESPEKTENIRLQNIGFNTLRARIV